MPKTKVLVVDDSALIRQLLTDILRSAPEFEVVGAAGDPYAAWDAIKAKQPDVLTLDVEMPRMDGLTFLAKLMAHKPMPVVMVSSLTEKGCDTTFRALELGAVDFVTKPKIDVSVGTMAASEEIISKVRAAAAAKVQLRAPRAAVAKPNTTSAIPSAAGYRTTHKVIAIGASTGGCEALSVVLGSMPADSAGIVAVIHMPEGFTKSFAERLNRNCAVRVAEAKDGDRVLPGHVLLAPGNFHMEVLRSGAYTTVRVRPGDPVNRHRPSVDVLFDSCAKQLGTNASAAILTGMGNDGAKGLLTMRRAGARTCAQDEATSVVFGMPKEAIQLGAAERVLPLDAVADHLYRTSVQL